MSKRFVLEFTSNVAACGRRQTCAEKVRQADGATANLTVQWRTFLSNLQLQSVHFLSRTRQQGAMFSVYGFMRTAAQP